MSKLVVKNGMLRRGEPTMETDFNEVYPFKGRTIDTEKPIQVYRNLNRKGKWYSVRQNGLVVAHATAICIRDCKFMVNDSGKDRAVASMQRNVHAFIEGYYATTGMGFSAMNRLSAIITYKPFSTLGFVCTNLTEKPFEVKGARFTIVNKSGVTSSYIEDLVR